jgi:hypothetical protein
MKVPLGTTAEAERLLALIDAIKITIEQHGYEVGEILTNPDLVYKHHVMKVVFRGKGQ